MNVRWLLGALLLPLLAWSQAAPVPPANDCAAYCDDMALRCPDVFLGNRATCLATCSLFKAGAGSVDRLHCLLPGQLDDTPVPQPAPPRGSEVVGPARQTFWDDHPQLRDDSTVVPRGMGALFVPSLGLGDREPVVTAWRGRVIAAEGRPGRRLVLAPDTYTLRFGDGAEHQQVSIPVQVVAGRTTVVPVSWGALEVRVVDPQFVPFRGNYELIRMDTREVVGLGFGADVLLGEKLRAWVLVPGIYKVVQSGGTYRDRTSFSTVRILPGEFTRYVLVQNPDTGLFEGAGLADDDPEEDRTWRLTGVIGGDVILLRSDIQPEQKDQGWSVVGNGFLDVAVGLNLEPHQWVTRLEVEESLTREEGTVSALKDRIYLHTIYTYALVSWFGPYVRARLTSHLLPIHEYRTVPGDATADPPVPDVDERVETAGPFAPMEFIEGAGGNFTVFRSREAELSVRVGLGTSQVLTNGQIELAPTEENPRATTPVENVYLEGVESTAIGQARITRWVTVSTEFDSLVPFDTSASTLLTWRSQANLRLASFASLSYRFNAEQRPGVAEGEGVQVEHNLQLRFSVTLF